MDVRRARGGALFRASRIVIVIVALLGAVLIMPAPAAPLDVISSVDRRQVACKSVRLSGCTDEGRRLSSTSRTCCDIRPASWSR